MKRVSFEVAKYLKEVGYPQDWDNTIARYIIKDVRVCFRWYREGEFLEDEATTFADCAIAPTYLAVWLWLWREKKECINIMTDIHGDCRSVCNNGEVMPKYTDPEEAIIAAIEYLVKNKLIK